MDVPSAFLVGQRVQVLDGPFADFVGVVNSVDMWRRRLVLKVAFFGRGATVTVDYGQVRRLN